MFKSVAAALAVLAVGTACALLGFIPTLQASDMARVQVKSASGRPAGAINLTFDNPTTSGNTVIVAVTNYYTGVNAGVPWTISDSRNNVWRHAVTLSSAATVSIYYAEDLNGGAGHRITLAASSASYFVVTAMEYSGLAKVNSFDGSASSRVVGGSYTSGAVTTSQTDALLLGVHHVYSPSTSFTPDTSWSNVQTATDGLFHAHHIQERQVAAPGSYASSGTLSAAQDTQSVVAVFRAAVVDTTPPAVSLTAPSDGSTVGGTVAVSATASDNNNVAGVQFKINGADVGSEDATVPYGVSWDTTSVANGSYGLTAVARDLSGNTTTSDPVVVTVYNAPDTTPPARTNGGPAGTLPAGTTSATLSLTTNEHATCRYSTLAGTAYADMPAVFTTTGTLAHSTQVSGLANGGSYSFKVRCADALTNVNLDDFQIAFSVAAPDTTPPTGALTAPAAGSAVTGTVAVTADAADGVAVASVQFQLDGQDLGAPDTAAPYQYSWNTTAVSNGSHLLRAVIRDTSNNVTITDPVGVSVSNIVPVSRIQAKSLAVANAASATITLNAATVTGNHLVLAVSCYYTGSYAGVPWTISDNKGNVWKLARTLSSAATVAVSSRREHCRRRQSSGDVERLRRILFPVDGGGGYAGLAQVTRWKQVRPAAPSPTATRAGR